MDVWFPAGIIIMGNRNSPGQQGCMVNRAGKWLVLTIFKVHIKCKLFFLLWIYTGGEWMAMQLHSSLKLTQEVCFQTHLLKLDKIKMILEPTATKSHYLVLFTRTTHFYLLASNSSSAVFLRDCQNAPSPVHGRELNCHAMISFKNFLAYSLNHNQSAQNM